MSMRDKLHTGELYLPNDDSILEEQFGYVNRLYDFNMTRPTELEKREKIARTSSGLLVCPSAHMSFVNAASVVISNP